MALGASISCCLIAALGLLAADRYVSAAGQGQVTMYDTCPASQAAIVLGAYVFPDGNPCAMLEDRIRTGVRLYKDNKVKKIIMTGDHGRSSYDEVNNMRLFAEAMGVPGEDIFMDHAGFSTYDSMYRARDIFMVDSAVIVTQGFHLPRAVYTARALGIDAVGVKADLRGYAGAGFYQFREIPARFKALCQVVLKVKPRFLGEAIPISGDGRQTRDGHP